MEDTTPQPQQTSRPAEKAAATLRPEAQQRRPPIRVSCECCAPAEERS